MLSPEKKFTLKIPATAILQCRTLLPWEKSAFFPKSSALYKINFLGQNIGTQCYAELINIGLACGTVLWFVTLQAHTCTSYNYVAANAMESFAKLDKLEQHTSLTNAHISTTKNYTALY